MRKYGTGIIVESGLPGNKLKHIKLVKETIHRYRLHIANHRGKWEATPFRDTKENLIKTTMENFPWVLADLNSEL